MSANVTRTLALIKPDLYAHHRHALPALRRRITAVEGFSIARERVVRWSPAEAGRFYAEHRERFFYARLVGYMSAGPFLAMELERDDGKDAVMHWRQLIGATSPYGARLGHAPHQRASLRALYGLTDTRNSFHGSDGVESARKELALFFDDARCDESLDLN